MTPRDLVARWEAEADLLRKHGATEAAATKERDAQELAEVLTQYELEQLTPTQAATETGYSAAHIRRLFKDQKRIPRKDLPKKANGA